MGKAKVIGNWMAHHKGLIFVVFFVVEISFLDRNSLLERYRVGSQKREIIAELDKYTQIYNANTRELHTLENNPGAIERIARERYFMKAADEDIYVVEYSGEDVSDNKIGNGEAQ